MLYLLLAIVSSAAFSLCTRLSSHKIRSPLAMLAVNYLSCLVIAGVRTGAGNFFPRHEALPQALFWGALQGVFYMVSYLLMQTSIRRNGVVLSATFMKLGLLVPMAVSIFLFGEFPTVPQLLGFLLAIGAILLINLDGGQSSIQFRSGLILLLLTAGCADTMCKIFEEWGNLALDPQFLLYTFMTALLLGVIAMLAKGERPGKYEIGFGLLVGIPNYCSAKFLLDALEYIPAVITYPSCNVATILLVTLAGILFFREKLSRRQIAAIGIILVALALLNL